MIEKIFKNWLTKSKYDIEYALWFKQHWRGVVTLERLGVDSLKDCKEQLVWIFTGFDDDKIIIDLNW